MKRALVTGGTGFVGANLVRRLLGDGHEVHLLVRAEHSPWRIADIENDIYLHPVELHDAARVAASIRQIRPEWIFHLAAHGAYPSQTDAQRMVEVNLLGTINLLDACCATGFEAFVHTGSSSEYGFKDHAPAETEWLEPNSAYAVTKASATAYCRFVARSRGVHACTLRLYSVYGPYEEPTRLIPTLILAGLAGCLPPLVNPDIARDYIYTEDVLDACLLAATTRKQEPGAVYNLGTGIQTSLRQVVAETRQLLGIEAEPVWGSMPARLWDTSTWVADTRKIGSELHWQPRRDLKDGLRDTADWFARNPAMLQLYRDRLGQQLTLPELPSLQAAARKLLAA